MRILIFGAGSTGCYIGAQFALAGIETHMVARPRIIERLEQTGGIRISSFESHKETAPLPHLHTELPAEAFDLCFVTLKCHHIDSASSALSDLQKTGCELHFLQNGLGSRDSHPTLQTQNCFSGITPFNVLSMENGEFHQGTEGVLQLQRTPQTVALREKLLANKQDCELYDDIQPVVYGKLLLNLNNAINAICDLPLKQELEDRQLRKILATAMSEYLALCKAKKQPLHISSPIPATWLPTLLRLPNWLFTRIAKQMLAIDPLARSSMWEDIQEGRPTEINYLNGAVARLCEEMNVQCPINRQITAIIKELEHTSDNKKPGVIPGFEELLKQV